MILCCLKTIKILKQHLHFAHYFESKVGRGLILEHSVSLNLTHGCSDLAVAIRRNRSNIGHVPREFPWYFL